MATLTLPQYTIGFPREERTLWRHYDGIANQYSVLIVGGVASTYPGVMSPEMDTILAADSGSGYGGRAVFLGGRSWEVTEAEAAILTNAHYNVSGGGFSTAFSAAFDTV